MERSKKIKLRLCIFLQMTFLLFYAQAQKQNHVRQKKEKSMKEKVICEPCQGKEKGILRRYHYFKISEKKDILIIEYTSGPMEYIEKYLDFDACLHIPMKRVPEVVKTMTDAFYLCNPWEPDKDGFVVKLEDSYFSASVVFADWMPSPYFMDSFFIAQRNFREDERQIHETINLEWDMETMSKVPLKGTRVMPKSLAALIKGLRDFYNEWQKAHPECERMKEKVFKEPVGASIFRVERKNELILINFRTRFYRPNSPKELIEQMQFHIANIPEVLKGLDFVFRAPLGRGKVYDINANGDKISLFSDTERSLREVNIATYINDNEIDKILEFNLERFDFPVNGAERTYTPAMLWLTKQMKKIYDEWQKTHPECEQLKSVTN